MFLYGPSKTSQYVSLVLVVLTQRRESRKGSCTDIGNYHQICHRTARERPATRSLESEAKSKRVRNASDQCRSAVQRTNEILVDRRYLRRSESVVGLDLSG